MFRFGRVRTDINKPCGLIVIKLVESPADANFRLSSAPQSATFVYILWTDRLRIRLSCFIYSRICEILYYFQLKLLCFDLVSQFFPAFEIPILFAIDYFLYLYEQHKHYH